MKRPWLKLVIFLLPALAGTLFVIWRLSPEQTIVRRANALFACLEKKTLESDTGSEKAKRIRILLHPEFTVEAPLPIPSGPAPPDTAAGLVQDLLGSIASSRISRDEERVTFPANGKAIYEATLQVDIMVARSTRHLLRYRCQFEFERENRDWLLRLVVLTAI